MPFAVGDSFCPKPSSGRTALLAVTNLVPNFDDKFAISSPKLAANAKGPDVDCPTQASSHPNKCYSAGAASKLAVNPTLNCGTQDEFCTRENSMGKCGFSAMEASSFPERESFSTRLLVSPTKILYDRSDRGLSECNESTYVLSISKPSMIMSLFRSSVEL